MSGSTEAPPILEVEGLTMRFGGLTAVDDVSFQARRGQITALIGPNGAGKTTFFNLLTGFDQPDSGSWTFNGTSLKGKSAYKVARLGMVRTFQLTKVLSKLTVLENMRMGATGALVTVLILAADALGPQLSGIVSTYPVILTVVGTFTHHRWGREAAWRVMRGLTVSLVDVRHTCSIAAAIRFATASSGAAARWA